MVDLPGISYLRTTREKTPVIYAPGEPFPVGGSRLVRHSDRDQVAVIAAGITVHEALKAYEVLKSEGITVRVIDAYSVKPIDRETLHRAARDTLGKLVVVEDHWFEGGLGDAVLDAFADTRVDGIRVIKLAVRDMPGSGTPAQLMDAAGIDADHLDASGQELALAKQRESPSRPTGFGGGLLANRSVGLSASRPRWATAQLRRLGLNPPLGPAQRREAYALDMAHQSAGQGAALRSRPHHPPILETRHTRCIRKSGGGGHRVWRRDVAGIRLPSTPCRPLRRPAR